MTVAVIGSGSWGTVAAMLVARRQEVLLFGRDPGKMASLAAGDVHPQLGAVSLPVALRCTADASDLATADLLLWAVPTAYSRAMAAALQPHLQAKATVVSLSKGLEHDTLLTPTAVLCQELGDRHRFAALFGPSHAEEVLQGQPTGLVAAGSDQGTTARLQDLLHHAGIRVYSSNDLLGVELGGALKNVIAIAAGICDGLGIGDNAKATLITRGLAELRRLGRAMGADDATFAGLAGIGDLLTTCYSQHGRNRALGLAIGRGQMASEYLAGSNMVAEGANTCRAAVALGRKHDCELPIASAVADVVWHGKRVKTAIHDLLARSAKEENP
jgi:glycerol-3-phosphate dehydrogenase (NAD(P)+)